MYGNEPTLDTPTAPKNSTILGVEGEYQSPEEVSVAHALQKYKTLRSTATEEAPFVFRPRSGSTKYVASCSCGVRFDMDSEDANRILTDPIAYDELVNVHKAMLAHEEEARQVDYVGRELPAMHPAHTPRYWITLPATPPPGYDEYVASRPQKVVLGDEIVAHGDEDPALVTANL
jgi:hypothetical protein